MSPINARFSRWRTDPRQGKSLCLVDAGTRAALSNPHGLEALNGGLNHPVAECAMNDVLFLLLGVGGMTAMLGYAVFCYRN